MGKRKSTKPPPKKARAKLATQFTCPFCNSENSVTCEMDRETNLGQVKCNLCHASFTDKIDSLTEPVDIFHAWIDMCEQENAVDKPAERSAE